MKQPPTICKNPYCNNIVNSFKAKKKQHCKSCAYANETGYNKGYNTGVRGKNERKTISRLRKTSF